MEALFHNLGIGFAVALTFQNIFYCLMGCLLGTLIGVLPGIGPVATIAMLLPVTFTLNPTSALIMLAGIYYGAQYGGSTTAILVNIPGESSSVVTCLDGYQMARQGRAGPALGIAAIGSFFAGCVATVIIALFAPPLAEVALKFGPAEYFSLMVLGLIAATVLAHGSLIKAIAMVILGLLLGLVGTDVNSGVARFSFGVSELSDGIGFVSVAMGVFGFAEIIANLEQKEHREIFTKKVSNLLPSLQDFKDSWASILRGTALGSFLGILPGGGALLASFAAYTLEKKVSKNSANFGKGAIQGVAAPESANNAGAQTSFIPLLTLGIPSNPVMALMIGAMMIQGIAPGPQVMTERPQLFWGMIASMWVGNLMLVVLNLPLIGMWIKLLMVPYRILYPSILVLLLHRRLQHLQQPVRRHADGGVRRGRLHLREARVRAGAADSRLHPRAAHGGKSSPRNALVARGPAGVFPAPDQPHHASHCGFPAGSRAGADGAQEARGSFRRGLSSRDVLAVLALLPEHVAAAALAVEDPAENEEQVRQPVQVDPRGIGDLLRRRQSDERALGAPAHSAREMRKARGARPARKDEFLEPGQRGVEFVEKRLEPQDLAFGHRRAAGDRNVAAEVEQIVLDALQDPVDFFRHWLGGEHADHRVELVDLAEGDDARAVLSNARAVAKTGFAAVAGAGVDENRM